MGLSYIKKKLFSSNGGSSLDSSGWTAWPFDAGDYSATGGTFVATDTNYFSRYKIVGKTLFWTLNVHGTAGTTPTSIDILLPNTFTSKSTLNIPLFVEDGGGKVSVSGFLETADNLIIITPFAGGSYTDGATNVVINITLEIE